MAPLGSAAVALAYALDALVGEPPERVHPVALFGSAVEVVDRDWKRPGVIGGIAAALLPAGVALVAAGVTRLARAFHPAIGAAVAGLVLFCSTSLRMLLDEARETVDATAADLEAARERLPRLAGRDPSTLSAGEVRSAAVESAAENLADGLIGPLAAFAIPAPFSLPAAAGAAAWVKAVNTLDSMLGYPSKSHGRASARLDDAVMWLPARASAVLIALAARTPRSIPRARRWARAPPSPNSGWPMATLAAALDVRLEKPGTYVLNPGRGLPTVREAHRGVRIVGTAGVLAYALAGVIARWRA